MDLPEGFDYRAHYLPAHRADHLFERLWQELAWTQSDIVLFGRKIAQPRLTAWYADPGVKYSYSGLELEAAPWHHLLDELRSSLADEVGVGFNSVLCNAYRDGRDSMGWHADNEPELGKRPVIASISLGAERQFRIRSKDKKTRYGLALGHGSLLTMHGDSQQNYHHAVTKTTKMVSGRINLTFRTVMVSN